MRWSSSLLLTGLLIGFAGLAAGPQLVRAQSGGAPQWTAGGDDSESGCDEADCGSNSGDDTREESGPGSGGPGPIQNPVGAMVPGQREFRRQADENAVRLRQEMQERSRQAIERREALQRQAERGAQDDEQDPPVGAYRMPTVQGLAPGINPGSMTTVPAQEGEGEQQ